MAWLATILVLTIATLSIAAWARSNRVALGAPGWPWVVAVVSIGAVLATASAMLYAIAQNGGWVTG